MSVAIRRYRTELFSAVTFLLLLVVIIAAVSLFPNHFWYGVGYVLLSIAKVIFFLPLVPVVAAALFVFCAYLYFQDLGKEYANRSKSKNVIDRTFGVIAGGPMFVFAFLCSVVLLILVVFIAECLSEIGLWITDLLFRALTS
jgi:hypothetical protein